MTASEQRKESLKTLLGDDAGQVSDARLDLALLTAQQEILNRLYPYDDTAAELPARYELMQLEAAVYLINRDGTEGEIAHSENGISREYESAAIPDSCFKGLVPRVGVPR